MELLGEGGMGVVFKAVQKKLNRTVALKMLRSGLLASKEELKRFEAEAQAVARLKHPNIVTIHEIGEHEGRLFFSMDCIEGRSLAEIVGRTPLPPDRAARYTMRIAEAVHYAHAQGVLHRDLKPGNVLVDEKDQPHITDFGLAKELANDGELTRTGAVLGTPSYMSPEQASGRRKLIKPASDVYSLGAILYDLLTGRPPFRADSAAETLRQVMDQEPAPLRLLNAKVHRDLETICLKCLAKDPGRRYDSAQLLADDLGRFLRGEPILARRARAVERTYRWAKRYPTLSSLGVAAGIMLVLLAEIAHFSAKDAQASVETAPRMAKGLAFEFHQIGAMVSDIASDPRLVTIVSQTPEIAMHLQLDPVNNPVLRMLGPLVTNRTSSVSFGNWLLLGTNGNVLANLTEDPNATALSPKSDRDYFINARKLTNGYYVSKAYKSMSDERYKVAVIAPILSHGQFIGALGRMLAYTELANQTERTKTAVIAEMDGASPTNGYAVIWHPEQDEKSATEIPNDNGLRTTLDRVMRSGNGEKLNRYQDPVRSRSYKGLWVARLDPVPNTHLVQVYQVRDRVRHAQFTGGVLFIPCVVALAVWALRKHRNAQVCNEAP